MDLEEIGINVGNWVDSAQDRNYWRALVDAGLNLRFPYGVSVAVTQAPVRFPNQRPLVPSFT